VYEHLIVTGFLKGYCIWIQHGEKIPRRTNRSDYEMTDNLDSVDIDGLLYNTFRNVVGVEGIKESLNNKARKFYNLNVALVRCCVPLALVWWHRWQSPNL